MTNGGIINVGDTQIITNTVTSPISAAITNNGSLQFWQTTALTVSGPISGSGTVTKATGSGNLTLSGSNTFSGNVTVSSGTLTATGVSDSAGSGLGQGTQVELGSGTTFGVTVSSGTNSTTRALIANGGFTLANAGNGSLVLNGNVTNNGTAASTFAFNSAGTGTNVFGGIIGNTTNNSAVALNFQNTQIWQLSGNNTFTGDVTIGGGRVIVNTLASNGVASSLGQGIGAIRFGGFGTLPTLEYVGSGSTNNKQFKLGGGGTSATGGNLFNNGTGALVFSNSVFNLVGDGGANNINRALTLGGTNAADNTISGAIIDNTNFTNSTVSIVKDGTGKWILSGNSTYTGGTTISNGILQIGAGGTTGSVAGAITNNAALIFNRSDASTVSNAISGSGTVTKASGSGNLTLSGANTFSGNVTVSSGTLTASGVSDTVGSGLGQGTLVELGPNATLGVTVSSGTNSTGRELRISDNATLANSGNGSLVWNGKLTAEATRQTGSFTLAFNSAGTGTNVFAGVIEQSEDSSLVLNLNFQNTQIWRLEGANTFGGDVTIGGGSLIVTTLADSGTPSSVGQGTAPIRFGGFATTPTFEYVGSGSTNNKQFKLGGGGTSATGGNLLNNGTGALVFSNSVFNLVGDGGANNINRALTLGGTNAADNTISGAIIDNTNFTNSTVSIVKDGTGKWILSGNSTYTGGTTISNGILQIGEGGTTGSVAGAITNNGTLILNRSGGVNFTNDISGPGVLIFSNSLTLSGASTFSGNVTVPGGTTLTASSVADSGASSLGTGTQLTLGQGSSLNFTANSANSTARQLIVSGTTGAAWLRNSGTGAVVWSGNLVNQTTAGTGEFNLGGTGTGGNEFAGLLTDNGANALRVIKRESGTWKLSGNNTFTGLMDIFNGTLVATTMANSGTASSIGAGTTIRFGGFSGETGVLEYVGSGSTNNKQFKLGGGGTANTGGTILNNGSGALVFTNGTFNAAGDGTFANTARALTLGGTNEADNAITGRIQDNNVGANTNNTVSVVKDGTGKWILSGSNTYSGSTTVNGGSLVIVRTNLTATITPSAISLSFSNTNTGTFPVLYGGSLSGSGYGGVVASTTGLLSNQTASFDPTTGMVTVASTATPPTITSTNAFSGTVGVAFSNNVTATGYDPIAFFATNLPAGLLVTNYAGTNWAITGTPSAAGTFNGTLTATNAAGTNNQSVTFTIAAATPVDSSFSGWLGGGNSPSAALLLQYAYGASSASSAVSRSNYPTMTLSNSNLVLTYYVRKNAANLNLVTPQVATSLATNSWSNVAADYITDLSTNTTGDGVEVIQRRASVPVDGSRKFLRLIIRE